MAAKRKVEVFSAGCAACTEAVELVQRAACPSCEVTVHDMNDINVARRAKSLGFFGWPCIQLQPSRPSVDPCRYR